MSWSTAADVATTVGTLVALSGVVVTAVLTLKGQRLEREQAEATASRAEAAAGLTADLTQRVVGALEAIASASTTLPNGDPAPAGPPRPRWRLDWFNGDTYKLTNIGTGEAEAVTVAGHETLILRSPAPQTIGPGEAVVFLAVTAMQTSDATLTITWQDPAGGESTWRHPLPAKPR